MAAVDILADLPPGLEITEDVFEEVERITQVRLKPEERNRIRTIVRTYERYLAREGAFRGSSGDRRRVAKAAKLAGRLCTEFRMLLAQNPVLTKYLFWPRSYEDVLRGLENLRDSLGGHQGNTKKGAVPKFIAIGHLLLGLAEVYKKGGGKKLGVSRGTSKQRVSPFTTFAWEIMSQLPLSAKPNSPEALAATWEIIYGLKEAAAKDKWIRLERPGKRGHARAFPGAK